MTHRKGLMIILDGLGDRPSPVLDGATPLEAAATPHLSLVGSDALHRDLEAAEHGLGLVLEELLVLVEEGLALRGVHEEDGGRRPELHRGGEAPSAGSDDPVGLNALDVHDRK